MRSLDSLWRYAHAGHPVSPRDYRGLTASAFSLPWRSAGVKISMDGRGRALDNIFVERLWRSLKYEDVYLKGYASMGELLIGLTEYFTFYNGERPHQSLSNQTPNRVYERGQGGGAMIVDKFGNRDSGAEVGRESGQRRAAANSEVCTA